MFSLSSRQNSNMPLYFGNATMQHIDIGHQQPQICNSNSQPFAVPTTDAASTWIDYHRPDHICGSMTDVQNPKYVIYPEIDKLISLTRIIVPIRTHLELLILVNTVAICFWKEI